MNSFFSHTKEFLAIIWSAAVIGLITYALIQYGNQKEVLLYLLGYIGGIATTILGAYFTISDSLKKQTDKTDNVNLASTNTIVNSDSTEVK